MEEFISGTEEFISGTEEFISGTRIGSTPDQLMCCAAWPLTEKTGKGH